MNKKNNSIYSENLEIESYYTYDTNYRKVYDIKSLKEHFKLLIKNLNQKQNEKNTRETPR